MRVVFSSLFKKDLLDAETRYADISPRLADEFHTRVKEAVRAIIRWQGGDHVGPHGYPCRKCRPFPYILTRSKVMFFTASDWCMSAGIPATCGKIPASRKSSIAKHAP